MLDGSKINNKITLKTVNKIREKVLVPLVETDPCFHLWWQADQHKYLADDNAAIKIEPDMDCLDFCINESLEGLMGSYPFENEADIKPDIKNHEKDFSPTTNATNVSPTSTATTRNIVSTQQPTSVPTGRHNFESVMVFSQSKWKRTQTDFSH